MRKFCVLICLGLLCSMFHAAVMPMDVTRTDPATELTAHTEHRCEEPASTSDVAVKCDVGAHLCCLGLAAFSPDTTALQLSETALINPTVDMLTLHDYPNQQFKPPKPFIAA